MSGVAFGLGLSMGAIIGCIIAALMVAVAENEPEQPKPEHYSDSWDTEQNNE